MQSVQMICWKQANYKKSHFEDLIEFVSCNEVVKNIECIWKKNCLIKVQLKVESVQCFKCNRCVKCVAHFWSWRKKKLHRQIQRGRRKNWNWDVCDIIIYYEARSVGEQNEEEVKKSFFIRHECKLLDIGGKLMSFKVRMSDKLEKHSTCAACYAIFLSLSNETESEEKIMKGNKFPACIYKLNQHICCYIFYV